MYGGGQPPTPGPTTSIKEFSPLCRGGGSRAGASHRAVFLGSAPSGATRGIDARQIRLGVVQPGHGVATYNDALGRMTGNLYYLYNDNDRYFFHAEENLNKVANDRANNLSEQAIDEQIIAKLNDAMKEARSRRRDVILYSGDTADVPDDESSGSSCCRRSCHFPAAPGRPTTRCRRHLRSFNSEVSRPVSAGTLSSSWRLNGMRCAP